MVMQCMHVRKEVKALSEETAEHFQLPQEHEGEICR